LWESGLESDVSAESFSDACFSDASFYVFAWSRSVPSMLA
jgi:hypothetical protein